MKLSDLTRRELAGVLRRRHAAAVQAERGARIQHKVPKPQNDGSDFMAWLHDGLPCIACIRLGTPRRDTYIEAAHQKLNRADRGWHKRAGRRGPHRQCLPLCAFHHRTGSPCCDPAQEKFWAIVGYSVDQVIDLNEALNAAFDEGRPGAPVIRNFARKVFANAG